MSNDVQKPAYGQLAGTPNFSIVSRPGVLHAPNKNRFGGCDDRIENFNPIVSSQPGL